MVTVDTQSLTEEFTEFALEFSLSDSPEDIVTYARLLVLDLLGCAIGGLGSPEEISARAACQHMDGGTGSASLWGTGVRASPRNAAMFNGIIAHVLELDDFLGIDHTGAVVIPALFALMEHENDFDEVRFLEAMILSYEIGRRMLDTGGGYSKHNSPGWHTTGTLGAYAAAVAASKYLGLSLDQTVAAIGLSGSVAGGTWAFAADGSMSKRYHPGIAAQNGISAAYMAREGFTGPRFIIEAEWGGYFAQFAPNHRCDVGLLFADLGADLRLGWAGIKPYACCRGCHSAIDAMHEIRKSNTLSINDIVEIKVTCSVSQHRQLGNPTPETVADAQLSMPFAIASALQFDTIGPNRFSNLAITDHTTTSLTKKVTFDVQESWVAGREPEFRVVLGTGAHFDAFVPVAKGDRGNPVPMPQVIEKFTRLVENRLTREDQVRLISFGLSETNRPGIRQISEILRVSPSVFTG